MASTINSTAVAGIQPATTSTRPDPASTAPSPSSAAFRGIDFQLESTEGYTWRLKVSASGSGKLVIDTQNAPPGKQLAKVDLTPSGANVNTTPGKSNPVAENLYYVIYAIIGSESTDCRTKYGLDKVPGGCAMSLTTLWGSATPLRPDETRPLVEKNISGIPDPAFTDAQVAALKADIGTTLRLGASISGVQGGYALKAPCDASTYDVKWIVDGKCRAELN